MRQFAHLRVLALDSAQVYRDGHPIGPREWSYAKPRELLYYLLEAPSASKEQIGTALWPWSSATQLRNSFHTTLHHLRKALGHPDWIIYRDGRYAFNREIGHEYDVAAFTTRVHTARTADSAEAVQSLDEAITVYKADFLSGVPGEQWIDLRRAELCYEFERVLLTLGGLHADACRYIDALEVYQRAIRHDELLESAHRGVIRCYARMGERARALRHYRDLTGLLREQLGVLPCAESNALHSAVPRRPRFTPTHERRA